MAAAAARGENVGSQEAERSSDSEEEPVPFPTLVDDDEEEDNQPEELPRARERSPLRGREGPRYVPFFSRRAKGKRGKKKTTGERAAKKKVCQDITDLDKELEEYDWLPTTLKREILSGRVAFKAMKRLASEDSKSLHIIKKITDAEEIAQAGCTTRVKAACGVNARKRLPEEQMSQPLHNIPKRTRKVPRMEVIKEAAYKFYMDDQNSRCSPGKQDYVRVNGEKLQKRICNDYVRNLHTRFRAENPDMDICLATFYACRPANVLTSKYLNKDTTCCQKHQNFQLLIKALAKVLPNVKCVTSPDAFIEEYNTEEKVQQLLNTFDEEAHTGMIVYDKWGRVNDEREGKVKTRIIRVEEEPQKFMENFLQRYILFVKHNDSANTQYDQQRRCKRNLKKGECLVQVDFIQNYACLVQNAAQSSFFDQTQVTVHASVIYYREEDDGDLKHKSFVHASPVNTHNSAMVYAILDKLWTEDFAEEKERLGLHTVHYYSDSPFSQYRNKWMFHFVSKHQERYGMKATWDYFETGHGKGPCDGVGGSIKRLADDAQKMGYRIQDAEDFVGWAQQSTSVSYTVSYISQERFDRFHAEYTELKSDLVTLHGTKKLHAVRPGSQPGMVEWRALSCKCVPEDNCNCEWFEASIRQPEVEEVITDGNGDTDIQPGDNVILEFQANIYLAQAMHEEPNGFYNFKLYYTKGEYINTEFKMIRSGKRIIFPQSDILHKCEPLKNSRRSADIKKMTDEDLAVFNGYVDLLMA